MRNISTLFVVYNRGLTCVAFSAIAFVALLTVIGTSIPVSANQQIRALFGSPTAPGIITGTVIDTEGNPVANVAVYAYLPAQRLPENSSWYPKENAMTDAGGNYTFDRLEVGLYKVGAVIDDGPNLTTFNGNVHALSLATEIPIAGNRVDDINITLIRSGEIGGTVALDNLLPEYDYDDVTIHLYNSESVDANARFAFDSVQLEGGAYRIARLLPGEYKACASIQNSAYSDSSRFFLQDCFDASVGNLDDAEAFSIRGDTVLPNINFVLGNIANYGQLSGQITDNLGNPVEGAHVVVQSIVASSEPFDQFQCRNWKSIRRTQLATRESTFEFCTITDADGQYSMQYIVPKRYTVAIDDPSGTYAPTYYGDTIDIENANVVEFSAASNLADIDFVLSSASRITGTISIQGVDSAPKNTQVIAYRKVNEEFLAVEPAYVDRFNGAYELTGLPAGTYSVTVSASAYDQDGNVGARVITVAESSTASNVDFSLAEGLYNGVIQGQITQEGVPLEGVRVELLGPETGYPVPDYFTETDSDGQYKIEGLGEGENYLGFVDRLGRFARQFYNQVTRREEAEAIIVGHNETVTIDVDMQQSTVVDGQVGVPTNLDVSQEPTAPETQWTDTIFMPFVRQ